MVCWCKRAPKGEKVVDYEDATTGVAADVSLNVGRYEGGRGRCVRVRGG